MADAAGLKGKGSGMGPEPVISVQTPLTTLEHRSPAPPTPCEPQEMKGKQEKLLGAEVPLVLLLLHYRAATAVPHSFPSSPT